MEYKVFFFFYKQLKISKLFLTYLHAYSDSFLLFSMKTVTNEGVDIGNNAIIKQNLSTVICTATTATAPTHSEQVILYDIYLFYHQLIFVKSLVIRH